MASLSLGGSPAVERDRRQEQENDVVGPVALSPRIGPAGLAKSAKNDQHYSFEQ